MGATKRREVADSAWRNGDQYLLRWDEKAVVTTSAGLREARMRGEALIRVSGDHTRTRGLTLTRFGAAAGAVRASRGSTGKITVRTLRGSGAVAGFDGKQASLRVDAEAEINYESLDVFRGIRTDQTCYYIPAMEPAAVQIEAAVPQGLRGKPLLTNVAITVVCAAGGFEEVQSIRVTLARVELIPIDTPVARFRGKDKGQPPVLSDSNTDANICISVNKRRVVVQPVGFRSSAGDPNPSGGTAAAQFATAQTVWDKACIEFQIKPTVLITDATLKTSSNLTSIRAAFDDVDPDVIEVFFVDNLLTSTGGGNAGGIGVASCKVVMAEPNAGNPVLLAHELGHVLGLLHPPPGNSDNGSVMQPTGSASNPGTSIVTHLMTTSIATPVIETLASLCCLSHDIPNHYIRDFPVDAGNEPSDPLPPGMNRYAMSNVWNRLSNTPGVPSALTGPEHEQPVRFNADSSPFQNFLFARVEQLVSLPVRNAVVKFFLKHPGSGGGAANLQLLGQASVPNTLSVGFPANVSIAWNVPPGTPNHSCVFAVVRSDAEQDGDQSALDWWQFEALSHDDNDWAQRNLDLEDFDSNANAGNFYESAPFLVFLPPEELRDVQRLTLQIDARPAKGLRGLAIEIAGGKTTEVKPGDDKASIAVDIRGRREPVAVIVRGEVPAGVEPGTRFMVGIEPRIGERQMIGFAVAFRAAIGPRVVAQTLDVAAAALLDASTFFDVPSAHVLGCQLSSKRCERPYGPIELAKQLAERRELLERLAQELPDVYKTTAVTDAIHRLLEAILAFDGSRASALNVEAAFRAVCNRIAVATSLVAMPWE